MRVEYQLEVVASCPADDLGDVYEVTILATRTIPVERILEVAASMRDRKIYQEDLTQEFARELGAQVESVGRHSGVRTRVVCGVSE